MVMIQSTFLLLRFLQYWFSILTATNLGFIKNDWIFKANQINYHTPSQNIHGTLKKRVTCFGECVSYSGVKYYTKFGGVTCMSTNNNFPKLKFSIEVSVGCPAHILNICSNMGWPL